MPQAVSINEETAHQTITPEELAKIKAFESRMVHDFPFYADRVIRIVDKEKRLVPLHLNPIQRLVQEIKAHIKQSGRLVRLIIDKARQFGLSTEQLGENFHFTTTNPNTTTLFVSHDPPSTKHLFEIVKRMYDKIPDNLAPEWKPDKKRRNGYELAFDDIDSTIRVGTAGSDNLGSSQTINRLHLSEASKYPAHSASTLLTSLLQTVPKSDPDSEVVVESTANGVGGEYHDMYFSARYRYYIFLKDGVPTWRMEINIDADPDNEYSSLFIPCFAHEKYRQDPPLGFVRTKEEEGFVKDYGVGDEFLQWRRHTIANECKGNVSTFHQEYPCITGDARVGTDGGIIYLRDAFDAKRCELGEITGFYPKGEKEVYRLTTTLGYSIKGTAEHLISIADGSWKRLDALTPNDRVRLSRPMLGGEVLYASWYEFPSVESFVRVDERWGRFLGYFMGDGSYGDTTLSVACDGKDGDIVDDVKRIMKELFDLDAKDRLTGDRNGCCEVRVFCKRLLVVLCGLGIVYQKRYPGDRSGGWKRKVCVPEVIWRSPRPVVREFLRGLFESDGFNGYGTPRVVLFNKDKQFIQDIQLLLLAFGITSRLVSLRKKAGEGRYYIGNELQLRAEEAIRFNEEIGFISYRKRNRHSNRPNKKRNGSPRITMVLEDSVSSVVPCGMEEVYDISVDGSQAFSANGIIVHNCNERESFLTSGRPVFDNERIQEKIKKCIPPRASYVCTPETGLFASAVIRSGGDTTGLLQVWEEPRTGVAYVISADVSEGLEIIKRQTDFSSVDVVEQLTGKQVAHFHGKIDPVQLGMFLYYLGLRYNKAWVVPERNNHGTATVGKLFEMHYQHLYSEEQANAPHRPIRRYGFLTHGGKLGDSKALVIDNLVELVNKDADGIQCADTYREMLTFKHSADGKLGGEVGCFDDRVSSISIAAWTRKRLPLPSTLQNSVSSQQQIPVSAFT
jgi:intein/homing endonuclease